MTRLHVKDLLSHRGELFIHDDEIAFKGWKTIKCIDVIDL